MAIGSGPLSFEAARELNDALRQLAAMRLLLTQAGHQQASPRLLDQPRFDDLVAQITGGDGNGNYAWTEQFFTSSGTFADLPNGRTGTVTDQQAVERNGAIITAFPFYALLRSRYFVNGTPIYEFAAAAMSSGPCQFLGGKLSNINGWDSRTTQILGHDASGCLIWFNVAQCGQSGSGAGSGTAGCCPNVIIPNTLHVSGSMTGSLTAVGNMQWLGTLANGYLATFYCLNNSAWQIVVNGVTYNPTNVDCTPLAVTFGGIGIVVTP
jgi:hypothetical protein